MTANSKGKQQRHAATTTNTTTSTNTNTATTAANPTTNANASSNNGEPLKPIELSENFYINNKKKNNVKIQVKLSREGIYLRRETEQHGQINEQLIRIQDIIGSWSGPRLKRRARGGLSSCKRITEDDQPAAGDKQRDISAFLYVYAYVLKEKPIQRCRTLRILRFRSFATYEENLRSAERWHHAIRVNKSLSVNRPMDTDKQLLILLNPKSGSGKGREMFQKHVAPILKEADIAYDLQVTTHANYARELVRKRSDLLSRYNGIVVAAGDGLLYEVLNGIMERKDWSMIIQQLPVGIIPCGSGNGLAKSIAHQFREPYEPKPVLNATLTCISGNTTPLDVVRIELAHGQRNSVMYSFLSIGWGLIADIDIESERLRSLGSPRFTIWSIHRIISLRTNRGKLSYLPWRKGDGLATSPTSASVLKEETANNFTDSETNFYDAVEAPNRSDDNGDIDGDCDEFADAISLDGNSCNVNSWHSATSRRTAYYSIGDQSLRSQLSRKTNIYDRIEAANAKLQPTMQQLPTNLPPLDQPVPNETWHCEEDDFIMVHAAYTTHLGSDCYFVPQAQLNDGIIYLVIIRKGVSRAQLTHFLLSMSTGSHIPEQPNEHIQVVPVRAFRIEPQSMDGIMAVDGERIDCGLIQAEIFPGLLNVMVPRGNTSP